MFITFEGLDLSGKTTQAELLMEKLKRDHVVHFLREPGGTFIAERLREILLDRKHLEMCAAAELFLFSASRAQLVREVILPALQKGETVVCDRFDDSTTAYQGYGRRLSLEAIRQINDLATAGIRPTLTFFVDIPVEEIEQRKTRGGKTPDRMESSGRAFYERVRAGYQTLAKEEAERLVTINGMKPVEEVHRQVWECVKLRMHAVQQTP